MNLFIKKWGDTGIIVRHNDKDIIRHPTGLLEKGGQIYFTDIDKYSFEVKEAINEKLAIWSAENA